jgi:hypothetical protein
MAGQRAGLRRDLGDLAGEFAGVAEADLVGRDTQDGLLEDGECVLEVGGLQGMVAGQEARWLVLAGGPEVDLGASGGPQRGGERGIGQVAF